MAIKLIAADMDGTVLKGDKTVSDVTKQAVKLACEAGAYVTLCSGRMPESVTPTSRLLGVNAPIICYNGALTYDESTRTALHEIAIPQNAARDICRFAEDEGVYAQCFWGGNFYYHRYTDKTRFYEEKAAVIGIKTETPLSQAIPLDAYKILMILDPGRMREITEKARSRFSGVADFQPSSATFLECVAKGVNKAVALGELCGLLGIKPHEVMAFGDEQNDVGMLKYAGLGYAMANAPEEIKVQCRHIAPPNDEDGVAKVIFELLNAREIGGVKF